MKPVVLMMTASSAEEAGKIARDLVHRRLAACGNVLPGLASIYWWKGKVREEPECLLIVKTREDILEQVEARIKELHSYEVPEIIALPILTGSPEYLAWIDEETRRVPSDEEQEKQLKSE